VAVALGGAWLLAGALFKLFAGTPADLPPIVQDLPLELGLTYKLAISIELAVCALAFLRPAWGWLPLAGAFLVFDAILSTQIAAGAENCGCFGGSIELSPWLMLSIDTVLLLAILVTRPWSVGAGRGAPIVLVVLLAAVGVAAPWVYDREASGNGTASDDPSDDQGDYVIFDVEDWVGRDIGETPLADYVDVYSLHPDSLIVLYRADCEHCEEHLSHMADTETGERFISLVRLRQRHDTEANRRVHRMPSGDFVLQVEAPDSVAYVVTTPAEIQLEAYAVTRGEEGVEAPH